MNKTIKHIFMISILLLLIVGVSSTVSAITCTPQGFLDNLSAGTIPSGEIINIEGGEANVSQRYSINASNIQIIGNKNVTFKANATNVHFIVNGKNVTINGINFENFKEEGMGGAIFWNKTECGKLVSCNFTNCTTNARENGCGGAIYWYDSKNGTVSNCTFNYCLCTYSFMNSFGGAIYWVNSSNGKISNCRFNNCRVQKDEIGKNNPKSSNDYYGGAIFWENSDNGSVINSIFYNCSVENYDFGGGGAIYWDSSKNGTIGNCTFELCCGDHGGAIGCSLSNGSISHCVFDKCESLNAAGAIYCDYSSFSVIDSNFTNCGGETVSCGALMFNGISNSTVKNCYFNNCIGSYAGAISYIMALGYSSVINSTFIDCNCISLGSGGIFYYGTSMGVVRNSSFINCSGAYGGAISLRNYEDYYYYSDNATLTDNNFINCSSNYGDIYNEGNNLTISGGNGALVYNIGTLANDVNVVILNNRTVGVAKNWNYEVYAVINMGDYIIVDPSFIFVINNTDIQCAIKGSKCTAVYKITSEVGDEIPVCGKYANARGISYETAILLVKNIVNITGTNMTLPYERDIIVKLNLTSNGNKVKNGTVNVVINGVSGNFSGNVSNGQAIVNVGILDVGVYSLTAFYIENHDYLNDTYDFTINITKTNPILKIKVDDVNYGEYAVINIVNNPTMSGKLYIYVNENIYEVSANSSEFIIKDLLPADEYKVIITYYGDKNFNGANNDTRFTVKKIATNTSVKFDNSTNDVVIYISSSDIYGNPVNGSVYVAVSGSNYYAVYSTAIVNGVGNLTVYNLKTGLYDANITFNPTNNYEKSYAQCSFKTTSTPEGFDLISYNVYKEFENDTQYHAKVTDGYGNPLSNMTVSVSISSSKWAKNANYTIVTNKDGIATLMINLLPGDYKITAHFADKVTINNISVIASNFNLKANNLIKYFMNGTEYTVKVTDVNGNPVANRTVTIIINRASWKNPVKYYVKTSNDGIATLDINLIAGTYSVTSNICYNSTKSTITVLPTLTASSITKSIKQSGSLKAKLVDGRGNPAAGKEVTFTVKDKVYTFTTNSEGIATLPIHLGLGTWYFLIACDNAQTRATVKVIK